MNTAAGEGSAPLPYDPRVFCADVGAVEDGDRLQNDVPNRAEQPSDGRRRKCGEPAVLVVARLTDDAGAPSELRHLQ
ncbi:MAG: hypothetical protein F4205_06360 [Gemmatimonadetes bacterium]|nr:hypothetical protein [Gemmatimonadota bacterium]MYG35101.1 hypothetical protein [Gemmatimonadota bacterium]